MTDQDRINAIITAIQTDANIILLLRQGITNQLPNMQSPQLHMICVLFGINDS